MSDAKTLPKWTDISSSEDFQQADWQTKQAVRARYFDKVVRPNTPRDMVGEVQGQFFTRTEPDVFGERESAREETGALEVNYRGARGDRQALENRQPVEEDPDAGVALRGGQNLLSRATDLAGSLAKGAGRAFEEGEAYLDRTFGRGGGIIGGEIEAMRERGYEPDVSAFGYGVDFTASIDPEDTSLGLERLGKAIKDTSQEVDNKFTVDRLFESPSVGNALGMIAEQGPAAVVDMAAMVANLPLYTAARTQELAEERATNQKRHLDDMSPELKAAIGDNFANGTPIPDDLQEEARQLEESARPNADDYMVSALGATLVSTIDRLGFNKLLPQGSITKLRQIPGAFGRGTAIEAGTEALQEGGIEYGTTNIGTKEGWKPMEAVKSATAGAIIGGPVGGAVSGIGATMEYADRSAIKQQAIDAARQVAAGRGGDALDQTMAAQQAEQAIPDPTPPGQLGETRTYAEPGAWEKAWQEQGLENPSENIPDTTVDIQARPRLDESAVKAAELVSRPRSSLSDTEREARDSVTHGEGFDALRSLAEQRGDTEAVAELDAIRDEAGVELEAETLAASRQDREGLAVVEGRMKNTGDRLGRVVERLNTPPSPGTTSSTTVTEIDGKRTVEHQEAPQKPRVRIGADGKPVPVVGQQQPPGEPQGRQTLTGEPQAPSPSRQPDADGLLRKSDDTPFATERSARASGQFRDNPGAQVVPDGNGFAIRPAGIAIATNEIATATPAPSETPRRQTSGAPFSLTRSSPEAAARLREDLEEFSGEEVADRQVDAEAREILAGNERSGVQDETAEAIRAASQEGGEARFSFAGQRAATADAYSLDRARAMLDEGRDSEAVRRDTGWSVGADGKPRFEIDDSEAQLRSGDESSSNAGAYIDWIDEAKSRERGIPLSQALDHPKLFAAYPRLAATRLKIDDDLDGRAVYIASDNEIRMRDPFSMNEKDGQALSTLLHEIQHGIQTIEDFARGGDPREFRREHARLRDRVTEINAEMREASRNGESDRYADLMAEREEIVPRIQELEGADGIVGADQYRRLAGEAEARNVQARQGMSEAQRRETAPGDTQDVADSDVIVAWNGQVMSSAPVPENAPRGSAAYRMGRDPESLLAHKELDKVAQRLSKAGVPTVAVLDESGLPKALRDAIERDGVQGRVKGVYYNGTIWLVSSNIDGIADVMDTVLHEALHQGLRPLMGNDIDRVLDNIYRDMPASRKSELEESYAGQLRKKTPEEARRIVAEEYVAHLAETDPESSVLDRVVSAIRMWLRKVFGPDAAREWGRKEIVDLIKASHRVTGVDAARDGDSSPRFSLAPPVESQAFKRWFGDSKVVDENGDPLVVYHGSRNPDITAFNMDRGGRSGHPAGNLGFHFTTSRPEAEAYGDNVYEVYLKVERPAVRDFDYADELSGPLFDDMPPSDIQEMYREEILDAGNDGLELLVDEAGDPFGKRRHFVVADPTQIKSVDNQGTFDADNPDIRYALKNQEKGLPKRNPGADTVSVRYPKAVKKAFDPLASYGRLDTKAIIRAGLADKQLKLIESYPNYRPSPGADTAEKKLTRFRSHVESNLLWLFDLVPADVRADVKRWYDGANRVATTWADRYDISDRQASGVIAVLSPQKDWFQNASLAERTLDILTQHQDTPWTDDMTRTMERIYWKDDYDDIRPAIQGKRLSDIDDAIEAAAWIRTYDETYHDRSFREILPDGSLGEYVSAATGDDSKVAWGSNSEIAKAIHLFRNGDDVSLNRFLGSQHKVRNFYNNIIDPGSQRGFVTIDTHAVAAGLLQPLAGQSREVLHNFGSNVKGEPGPGGSTIYGVSGTYAIYAEAYRSAAKKRGVLPREMQSITWEMVRALFTPGYKAQAANTARIEELWAQYKKGRTSLEKTREAIWDHAGGIDFGRWDRGRPDRRVYDPQEQATYERNVSGAGLPGPGASGGTGRRGGVDAAGAVPGGRDAEPKYRLERGERQRRFAASRPGRVGNEGSRGFERRSPAADRRERGVLATFEPTPEFDGLLEESELASVTVNELEPTRQNALRFSQAITRSKREAKHGAAVYVYPLDEYRDMRMFMTPDGKAGLAIKPDGDIVSVFSDGGGKAHALLTLATEQGGTKLDAFRTVLPSIYKVNGFREVDSAPWDDQYRPEGWREEDFKEFQDGRPDVVFMEYDPAYSPFEEDPRYALTGETDERRREPARDGRGRPGDGQTADGADATPERPAARQEATASGQEGSPGRLEPLPGAPRKRGITGPDPGLVRVAEDYAEAAGIDLKRQAEYVEVDPDLASRIAQAYEDMEHAPQDPRVKEAYRNLIDQTRAQYDALADAGYEFYLFDGDQAPDPYDTNPSDAMRDLRDNKRMGVFSTEAGFGSDEAVDVSDNPLLEDTGLRWPLGPDGPMTPVLANDLFRAVHDAFGHGLEGAGFRARGEENAWQAHARLFTGSALGALTSETRGQNSWLNFGPMGAHNRTAGLFDTVFADQKTGLMPSWAWEEGVAGDLPSEGRGVSEDRTGPDAEESALPDGYDSRRESEEGRVRTSLRLRMPEGGASASPEVQEASGSRGVVQGESGAREALGGVGAAGEQRAERAQADDAQGGGEMAGRPSGERVDEGVRGGESREGGRVSREDAQASRRYDRRGEAVGREDDLGYRVDPSEEEVGAPRYSLDDSTNFAMPDDRYRDVFLRKIADKFRPIKRLQQAIAESGGRVSDDNDTYLAEELYYGKVESDLRRLEEGYVKPLIEGLAEAEISQSDLDTFLYARHAPERNTRIAARNPDNEAMQDGGSGMTDAQAAEVMDIVDRSGKRAEFERLASIVDGMLAVRREAIREGGLMDDDTMAVVMGGFEHYVPLKGWARDEDVPVGEKATGRAKTGRGFEVTGKESKIALGRKTVAASPSTQAIVDTTESMVKRRKNEVAQSLLSLVTDNPNPNLWEVFTQESPDTERRAVTRTDPDTGQRRTVVQDAPVSMGQSDRYLKVKKGGRQYFIKIHNQQLMDTLRNVGVNNAGELIEKMAGITRIMSSLMTSWNPEFMVTNFIRDAQTALLNIQAEQSRDDGKLKGKKIGMAVARDIRHAMRAAYRGLAGKPQREGEAGEWDRWFTEFMEAGGKTGYFDMKDVDRQAKDLQKMMVMAQGGAKGGTRKAAKTITDFVETTNGAVENAVRLATYANARREGLTKQRAASMAKNMTVNFNRRGEMTTTLGALYMFFNASVQGTANFVRTMGGFKDPAPGKSKYNPWARLNIAQKIGLGMVAGAFINAMLQRLLSDEDDDGVKYWDKVPDHVKERSFVFMTGWATGDPKDYVALPLPYGYNIFTVLGTQAEAVAFGGKHWTDGGVDVTLAALGSFNPVGFEDSEEATNVFLKNATPTLFRSLTQLAINENFAGRPIYDENFEFGTPLPDSSLSFPSTPEAYKRIAEFANQLGGGNRFEPGLFDVSPDSLQHLVNFYGGGAWSFVEKTGDAAYRAATGEEIKPYRVPFAGRVMGEADDEYRDQSTFYDRRERLGQRVAYIESLEGSERREASREQRDVLRMFSRAKKDAQRLSEIRNLITKIETNERMSEERREKLLEEYEERKKRIVDEFNKEFDESIGDL